MITKKIVLICIPRKNREGVLFALLKLLRRERVGPWVRQTRLESQCLYSDPQPWASIQHPELWLPRASSRDGNNHLRELSGGFSRRLLALWLEGVSTGNTAARPL